MGLLDKLWDDTVAGPRPDTGLGRLRKHASFSPATTSARPNTIKEEVAMVADQEVAPVRVTRSIMIKRPAGYCPPSQLSPVAGSSVGSTPPASPAGNTPPVSPFATGGGRFRRKSSSDAYDRSSVGASTQTPPFEV